MKQKIIKVGNSVGIIIPQELREEAGLTVGDNVMVEYVPGEKAIAISKEGKSIASVTPNYLRVLEKVNKQYGPALKELAQK